MCRDGVADTISTNRHMRLGRSSWWAPAACSASAGVQRSEKSRPVANQRFGLWPDEGMVVHSRYGFPSDICEILPVGSRSRIDVESEGGVRLPAGEPRVYHTPHVSNCASYILSLSSLTLSISSFRAFTLSFTHCCMACSGDLQYRHIARALAVSRGRVLVVSSEAA